MANDEPKEIKVDMDAKTLKDAGYDTHLAKDYGSTMDKVSRLASAQNLTGGALGSNTTISLGNGLLKIDGENNRIVINDGQFDRIIIGYGEF